MIDPAKAESAAEFLHQSAQDIERLVEQAEKKELMLKHVEGLLEKQYHTNGTPVGLCKAYARSDQKYVDAMNEYAVATAQLKGLDARRDAAKITIGLYQSQVKDRI